jgi:hypothetical protein
VLLDEGFGVNIIIERFGLRLGLPKPKPTPYNLRMADQTTTKLVGLIRDLKIYVHGILYITIFTALHNNVVDSSYSMLLGRPWLKDVKMARDWGSNIITLQGNGIIRIITITKHLGGEVRKLEMLLCYTIVFRIGLLPYLGLTTTRMKQDTLIEHKEVNVVCDQKNGHVFLNYNALTTNHTKS